MGEDSETPRQPLVPPPRARHQRGAPWLVALLAAWLGAVLLFAAVVAPAAFAVLPTRALAGALVGRVLPVLFWSGAVAGAVTVLAARGSLTGGARLAAMLGGVVGAAGCLVAQLYVGGRIERLRAAMGGTLDSLAPLDPRRVEFGRLHGISVMLLGAAGVALLIALVAVARARRAGRGGRDG